MENADRDRYHYARANDLFHEIYGVAPAYRLGAMRHILSFIPTDSGLRNILTDQKLLGVDPRPDGRKNIAKAADAYARKFHGLGIKAYIATIVAGEEPPRAPCWSPADPKRDSYSRLKVREGETLQDAKRRAMEALYQAASAQCGEAISRKQQEGRHARHSEAA